MASGGKWRRFVGETLGMEIPLAFPQVFCRYWIGRPTWIEIQYHARPVRDNYNFTNTCA